MSMNLTKRALNIAFVAGETSGDLLGAQLIKALHQLDPSITCYGIAGPNMQQAGCHVIFPQERIEAIGLTEILGKIPTILRIRHQFYQILCQKKPDIFIGIDAPDFNLPLERKLKKRNVFTVHYNSPKVWAWRSYRVKKIKQSVDLMLTQFPFEKGFYQKYDINAEYIGHPFADQIPEQIERSEQRTKFNLMHKKHIIALLPGSRKSELSALAQLFLQTADWITQQVPDCHFLVPLANDRRLQQWQEITAQFNKPLPLTAAVGSLRDMVTASDCALVAAGTATLETMLLKTPMVVTYRLSTLTYWLAKLLVNVDHIALPNLIAEDALVPEIIQTEATPQHLGKALIDWLMHPEKTTAIKQRFQAIHQQLRIGSGEKAANTILQYYKRERDRHVESQN